MYRYYYTAVCYDFDNPMHNADRKLFTSMRKSHHSHPLKNLDITLGKYVIPMNYRTAVTLLLGPLLSYVLCIIFVSNWFLRINFYWFFDCVSSTGIFHILLIIMPPPVG